jgi:hypothetical protein
MRILNVAYDTDAMYQTSTPVDGKSVVIYYVQQKYFHNSCALTLALGEAS